MINPARLADRTAREMGWAMPLSYKRSAVLKQNSYGID